MVNKFDVNQKSSYVTKKYLRVEEMAEKYHIKEEYMRLVAKAGISYWLIPVLYSFHIYL